MSNNIDVTTVLAGATKYRIGTRERLTKAGFVFTQPSTGVDEYTKGGVTAQFFHGAKNTMTAAEISDGKGPNVVIRDGQLKLERALAALLLGDEDKATPWYMTPDELKTLPPLGKGNGLIAVIEAAPKVAKVKAAVVPPKPTPKPRARKAPAARTKAPAPKAG